MRTLEEHELSLVAGGGVGDDPGGLDDTLAAQQDAVICWVSDFFADQVQGSYSGDPIEFHLQFEGTAQGAPFVVPDAFQEMVITDFDINISGQADPVKVHLSLELGDFSIPFLDVIFSGKKH